MLLETYQHRSFIKQSGNILTTLRSRETPFELGWNTEIRAYEWLRQQYQQHRVRLNRQHALIWAWPQSTISYPIVPHTDRRVAIVHLWLDVPDELVLLMNFEAWAIPLMGARFMEDDNIPIERDWEKLFDEAWLIQHEYAASDDWLDHQAVFPYVDRAWIKRIKYLRGYR